MYLARGVDMVLLMTIFAIFRAAMGVLTSPGYLVLSSTPVRLVLFGYSFCGQQSTTTLS